jgi:hypothetical protein
MTDEETDTAIFEAPPCAVCGKPAPFGFDVSLLKGKIGTWYCREHRPVKNEGNQDGNS